MLIRRRKVWTRQPQFAVAIDWSNPITRSLAFVRCPTTDRVITPPVSVADCGKIYSFNFATPTPIDTGVKNSSVWGHSCVAFVRHPAMSSSRLPAYISNLVSANSGFEFYQASAAGTFPDQTFTLALVHGGVAAYTSSVQIPGANTKFVPVGFVAGVSDSVRFYAYGSFLQQVATAGINQSTDTIRIGRDVFFSSNPADYDTPFVAYWTRKLSDAEVASISANPWQIFAPQYVSLLIASGVFAGAELSGYAQAQATAAGNLTLQASLDGAALSVATASGNLSTSIPLAGSAVAIGSANGSLTSGIQLSAAAVANALSSGSLVAQIKLNGAALAQAAASAGLTSAILLAGAVQGQASASGTLAPDPGSLSANAQAQATAVATLTTSIKLSGSAAAQAGVSGILTTKISLTAAALAQAIATGTLAVPILLAGAAHGVATATGNLTAPDSPASTVYFRVNSAVERVARVASAADRLTQARSTAQRLTSIKHEVQHV